MMTKTDYEMCNFVYEMLEKVKAKQFSKKDAISSLNRIVPVLKGRIKDIDTDTAIMLVWFGSFCVKIINGVVIDKSPNIEDFFKIVREVSYKDFYNTLDKIFKAHALIQQREI